MEKEKKYLLEKINRLIEEKRENLFKRIPNVHEIDDGIVIRFFTHWDNCEEDSKIKFKKIISRDDPNFLYAPR